MAWKKILYIAAILGLGAFFVWLYAWLGISTGHVNFNSPDETANYFWITRFARGEPLSYSEPLNIVAHGLIHPRSMNVVGDRIVPGSFLGMIFIYGSIAKLFGVGVIPWLTPFVAVIGVIFFGLLVGKIFNPSTGVVTALLAATSAPWWYSASKGMYHNTLFASLLLVGLFFLYRFIISYKGRSVLQYASVTARWMLPLTHALLAGFFIGLALITRMSEAGWVGLLVGLVLLLNVKRLYWPGVIVFLGIFASCIVPVVVANYVLYGTPLTIGYQSIGGQAVNEVLSRCGLSIIFKLIFMPFGFDLPHTRLVVEHYLVMMFWWWTVLAGVGFLYWFLYQARHGREKRTVYTYVIGYILIVSALILFYGSWELSDRIDKSQFSIGTSFIRYWLPIYLGALPFVAFFFVTITSWIHMQAVRMLTLALLIGIWGYASYNPVMLGTDESIMSIQENLHSSANKAEVFASQLPVDALYVIYPQLDKVMFPRFKRIITSLAVPEDYRTLRRLSERGFTYYVTFAPPEIVDTISRRDFEPYGMKIIEGKRLDEWDWVYSIQPTDYY